MGSIGVVDKLDVHGARWLELNSVDEKTKDTARSYASTDLGSRVEKIKFNHSIIF